MSALSVVRARIADDLNRSDLNTQIDKAINRAIEFYEKQRFWFNENTWTFVTVAGTESYTFSTASTTDLLEIDQVTLTRTSTDIYPLDQITFQKLRQINTTGTTTRGAPSKFALYKSTWYLYPVPDAVYTVTIYGQKSYAAMTADADTNDFTTDAEDLIEARARWWVYANILKDVTQATVAKASEIEALQSLQAKTANIQSTGAIRPAW